METEFIIDVSEADFQYEVLQFSQKTPVVVDFWAAWCGPCRTLGPLLERLAREADGRFRLAKVDVDANPNLTMRYDIRSIPAVKGFRGGQVIAEFSGLIPEPNIEKFLRDLAPGPGDLMLLRGQSFLQENRWQEAEENFRQTLSVDPNDGAALLGLARSLLARSQAAEALQIIETFPASKEYNKALSMKPLAEALLEPVSLPGEDVMEATYLRALDIFRRGNIPAALDGLLEVLRTEKNFRGGLARKAFLAMLEILGEENRLTRQYRAELASALF
jgi:putative thioredoxin